MISLNNRWARMRRRTRLAAWVPPGAELLDLFLGNRAFRRELGKELVRR